MLVWTNENGTFYKHLRHGVVSRGRFKIEDGRTHFVPLLLGIFSSLIACLEINIASLYVQENYVGRRVNITR